MNIANVIELSVSLALDAWLAVILLRRGAYRRFPVFFAFTVLETLALAARLLLVPNYRIYFYVYWCSEAVLLPLSLAALHEAFHWVFEGFYRIWWFRLFYYGTIVLVLGVAASSAVISPPVQAHPVISLILNVGIAVNFVRMGIVALFYVLKKLLLVEFRRHADGIVIGFGISSAGSLIGYLAFSGFGTKVQSFTQKAAAVAYILGLAIWVAAFIRPEREGEDWRPPMSPEQMLEEVRSYLKVLGISKRKQ